MRCRTDAFKWFIRLSSLYREKKTDTFELTWLGFLKITFLIIVYFHFRSQVPFWYLWGNMTWKRKSGCTQILQILYVFIMQPLSFYIMHLCTGRGCIPSENQFKFRKLLGKYWEQCLDDFISYVLFTHESYKTTQN